MDMKIELKGIKKKYGKKAVLEEIDLIAESGDCIGILGGNGSGKSTLLSLLAGVRKPDGGDFLYNGISLFQNPSERAKLVGYVPQGTPLIEELTAKDNLALWYSKKEMKKELENGVLKMLGIQDFINTVVSKMSGGMKKRLSIACAMSGHPPILIMDEPMAALDLVCKQRISEHISEHRKKGGIVLISTHDTFEITLCNKWYIIKDGKLKKFEFTGEIEEIVREL
jgi:ABC-2 type transport system ATP-binding protein